MQILRPNSAVKVTPGDGTIDQIASTIIQVDTNDVVTVQYQLASDPNAYVPVENLEPQEPVRWMDLEECEDDDDTP